MANASSSLARTPTSCRRRGGERRLHARAVAAVGLVGAVPVEVERQPGRRAVGVARARGDGHRLVRAHGSAGATSIATRGGRFSRWTKRLGAQHRRRPRVVGDPHAASSAARRRGRDSRARRARPDRARTPRSRRTRRRRGCRTRSSPRGRPGPRRRRPPRWSSPRRGPARRAAAARSAARCRRGPRTSAARCPERPPASVERTATLPEAAAVIVTAAPVASSNAPSPSRSHACVTPLPGLVALRTTVVPARGAAGWIRIDGDGRASSRAGATAGSAAANASSATAATRPDIRGQPYPQHDASEHLSR